MDPDTDGSSYLQVPAIDVKWDPSQNVIERGGPIHAREVDLVEAGAEGREADLQGTGGGLYTGAGDGVTGVLPTWLRPVRGQRDRDGGRCRHHRLGRQFHDHPVDLTSAAGISRVRT